MIEGAEYDIAGSASIAVVSAVSIYRSLISGTQPFHLLFDNASPVAGTTDGSGAGTQQDGGQVVVSLAAGDLLTLVNHSSSAAVGLASDIGGTQANVNASLSSKSSAEGSGGAPSWPVRGNRSPPPYPPIGHRCW